MPTSTDTRERATGRPRRVSTLEIVAGGLYLVVMLVLVALDPDILEAPFASTRAILATFGGAALVVVAVVVMIRLGVPPVVRVLVVGIPIVVASWWLLEPYFVDDVVEESFSTSIAEQQRTTPPPSVAPDPAAGSGAPAPTTALAGPQLIGSGSFVGLAGHKGTGDAGIFRQSNGSLVLRLENFDIDNGPDLELYLVPGEASYRPRSGSLHFGGLKGNVGNQTYEIPADFAVSPGPWTVLVWCKAFTVEFVGATLNVS